MASTQSNNFGETSKMISTFAPHPLDPLTPEEISAASLIARSHFAARTSVKALKFASSLLINPPKAAVLYALGLPLPRGSKMDARTAKQALVRRVECQIIDEITGDAYEVKLALASNLPHPGPTGKYSPSSAGLLGKVESVKKLPVGMQPGLTPEEVNEAEEILRADPRICAIAREVGIEPHQLYADGWSIGYDDRFDPSIRLQQCLVYARKSDEENLYAHPMDFYPVIDSNAKKVLAVDFPGHRDAVTGKLSTLNSTTRPGPVTTDRDEALGYAGRQRITPPMESFDYLPDLMASDPKMPKLRTDLKPLHVTQPEGVSFKMQGNELSWQKWKMHIGFHPRDGLVLSTVTYNDAGNVRPIVYRMSVAEMVVPYSSPEHPHPRKFAFDVGEYGMGTLSNSLKLGCDCLGTIHYLDGSYVGQDGQPVTIEKCICIHEEDAGIAWKHTDYRPGGRVRVARGRKLVVQMICTIANYEYIFNYNFHTDGSIQLETKLTGILNLYVKERDEPNPYGVEVAPKVNAHYHQHLFSLRIDPMVDGCENTVVQTDVKQTEAATGTDGNYLGNGFTTVKTPIKRSAGLDYDKHRVWSIVNPSKKHYASGLPASYKIHTKDFEPLALRGDSMVAKRAQFSTKALWVTPFEEEQLWPAGKYVPQQRDTAEDSLGNWVKKEESTEDTDVVVWLTYGITHIPRPEDWPVMPVEHLNVWLKPANFFDLNPAHDLPSLNDPLSRNAFEAVGSSSSSASSSCCSSTSATTTTTTPVQLSPSTTSTTVKSMEKMSLSSASPSSSSSSNPSSCACCASDEGSRL
ncbi:hypothetical protein IE53DRAFT_244019 [Violaceomyces palustris]|uniref:Uncharacterized protein n=1 Tax=Violaceomyces palustris TaxID=1673888 RepID=A0ACD0NP01_9BASI|nr:hypothetical protein IE53DRAFT_244019 [Violaceomyces palustris]